MVQYDVSGAMAIIDAIESELNYIPISLLTTINTTLSRFSDTVEKINAEVET